MTILRTVSQSEDLPSRQAALCRLGDVRVFLGDPASAREFYEEAIRLAEHTRLASYATYQVGRLALQAGDFDKAMQIFQRLAIDTDQTVSDDARLALVIAYLNQDQEGAANDLLDVIRLQRPSSVAAGRAAYYKALLALGQGDEATVQEFCAEAMTKAPSTDEALEARLLLADIQARSVPMRDVMQGIQDAYASPQLSRSQRAKLAKRLGDMARGEQAYADALRWYEEAGDWLPSLRGEMAYRMASCYEEAGDIELALEWYQRLDQPGWSVRGQLVAAKLLERQGRVGEAEAIYERLASESIPEAKLIRERLAVLRGAGD
jgi:tetratricopeptide (TPR) repeat protein